MSSGDTFKTEDVATKIGTAARHEAGHAVIAASTGIRLRVEGIMVDEAGDGLSCYCYKPGKADTSIEASVIASYAGFLAENHFRRLTGLPERSAQALEESEDWSYARRFASDFSDAYLDERSLGRVQSDLKERTTKAVVANWAAIDGLAQKLVGKNWEPRKPLGSGGQWSTAATAKYVACDEIVEFLVDFDIHAVCVENC